MMKLRGTTEGADCSSCPFSNLGEPDKPVVGIGPSDPMFIILGEGPGFNEVKRNLPFIGESGKCLDAALKQLGISRDKIYISNATLCHPKGANEKQRKEAAKSCRGRLNKELAQFPGRPVVVTGAVCASELFEEKKFKITEQSGAWYRRDVDGSGERDFIITLHPASYLRTGKDAAVQFWGTMYDLAKAAELATGEGKPAEENIEVITTVERTEEALLEFLEYAKAYGEIALDLETIGRKVYVDPDEEDEETAIEHDARDPAWADIIGIGLASAEVNKSISIDWKCVTERGKDLLQQIFDNVVLIIHNKTYDVPVLRWHGFR